MMLYSPELKVFLHTSLLQQRSDEMDERKGIKGIDNSELWLHWAQQQIFYFLGEPQEGLPTSGLPVQQKVNVRC